MMKNYAQILIALINCQHSLVSTSLKALTLCKNLTILNPLNSNGSPFDE